MFSKIRLKIGLSQLRKQKKLVKRQKMVHNFESARKIGIIFYASTGAEFDHAMGLVNFLTEKNIDVALLVYCPEKEVPQNFFLRKHSKIFTKKDLNWYNKPIPPFVEKFISLNFDILIDLSMQEAFPLRWVASLSLAKFKVGTLHYFGNPYDMVISLKSNHDLGYFITQIKHYLNLINNRFAQEKEWERSEKFNSELSI